MAVGMLSVIHVEKLTHNLSKKHTNISKVNKELIAKSEKIDSKNYEHYLHCSGEIIFQNAENHNN